MKTVLLVNNDPCTRDLVVSAFAAHPDLQLVLASSFHGALWAMCEQDVDLVISDLSMPERQGLDLLAYMANYRSKVPVLTLSPSHPAGNSLQGRLCWRGHLSAPLQAHGVISHVRAALKSVERGDYRPVGLHDLLRVLSHEQDTCTLQVKEGLKAGHLQIVRGKIVHAACGEVEGEAAARELLGWQTPWFRAEPLPTRMYESALDHAQPTEQVA
jgi:CheY-like chemotaxis protein